MFAVLAGAALAGIVGMLVALPLAAVINVLLRHAYDSYRDSEFYKGNRQYELFKQENFVEIKKAEQAKAQAAAAAEQRTSWLTRLKKIFG